MRPGQARPGWRAQTGVDDALATFALGFRDLWEDANIGRRMDLSCYLLHHARYPAVWFSPDRIVHMRVKILPQFAEIA